MDKKTFDIIMDYYNIENDLYFKLEKEVGQDKAEELLNDFADYRERLLKIGKYLDDKNLSNKEGFLTERFEDFPRYTKVTVIYKYDNGFSLCETTSGLFMLAPSELISFDRN